jgi:phosphonate transport system ATP-binding protein
MSVICENGQGATRDDPLPDASSAEPIVRVVSVVKTFGKRPAITDINLLIDAGSIVAVVGPSGAGKTTLFRCMAGLLAPNTGQVLFHGMDVRALPRTERHRIAVVFQQFNLVKRLTALENVLAGRLGQMPAWRGILRRFERDELVKAFNCLERVGMLDFVEQRADTLSGGQQQRIAIARALAQEPSLIVADEPIASLDPRSADDVMSLLAEIAAKDRVTVVCSLHQVRYARCYANRIIGLSRGHVMFDAPNHALTDKDLDDLYAGHPTGHTDTGLLGDKDGDPKSNGYNGARHEGVDSASQ